MDDPQLTVEEVAERLNRPIATVRRWVATGKLEGRKVGRQWLIDASALPKPRVSARRMAASANLDLDQSLTQLALRDLREPWVPDILNHEDFISERTTMIATAATRLASLGPFDPVTEIAIPKSPFFTRPASDLSPEDRLAYHAAVASLSPRIERLLTDSVYSARRADDPRYLHLNGRDQWLKWRKAASWQVTAGYSWMVKTDVTAYFDNIEHRLLFADIDRLSPDLQVASALKRMLGEWASVPGRGIPQGPDASRALANLYLIPVDDEMNDGAWKYFRYMDDIRVLGRNRRDVVAGVKVLERECRRRGLVLSAHKTELLVGHDAEADLTDEKLDEAQYWVAVGAEPIARHLLRRILRESLAKQGSLDSRRARFSLYRLRKLRDHYMTRVVLQNIETLAPIAPIVAEYLHPFLGRKSVEKGMAEFFRDPDRNTSSYVSAWLLAVYLDRPSTVPRVIVDYARAIARDGNQPVYHRAVAANVLALGKKGADVTWLATSAKTEFDPNLLRGYLVALARVGALNRDVMKVASSRAPRLSVTTSYLRGKAELPSVIFRARNVPIA